MAEANLARLPLAAIGCPDHRPHGKDISGLGMDSNVVGRYYTGPTGTPPLIQRIVVRDLTDETEGNAVGVGMADVVLRRLVERMDATKTYINCITAKTPEGARIAMTVDSDREAIDIAVSCCSRWTTPRRGSSGSSIRSTSSGSWRPRRSSRSSSRAGPARSSASRGRSSSTGTGLLSTRSRPESIPAAAPTRVESPPSSGRPAGAPRSSSCRDSCSWPTTRSRSPWCRTSR